MKALLIFPPVSDPRVPHLVQEVFETFDFLKKGIEPFFAHSLIILSLALFILIGILVLEGNLKCLE